MGYKKRKKKRSKSGQALAKNRKQSQDEVLGDKPDDLKEIGAQYWRGE